MNNEIKEILYRAKNLKYKCDCCEEIAPGKYVMRDDKQTDNLIEAVYIIDKLLDYITNLQQENEKIRKMNMHEHKYSSDMEEKYLIEKAKKKKKKKKKKNDRAVEYIKENGVYKKVSINNRKYYSEYLINQVLDVLNGRSDE